MGLRKVASEGALITRMNMPDHGTTAITVEIDNTVVLTVPRILCSTCLSPCMPSESGYHVLPFQDTLRTRRAPTYPQFQLYGELMILLDL